MIKKITIFSAVAIFIGSLFFSSCEKYILPALSFGQDTVSFSALQQMGTQSIKCNVEWKVDNGIGNWYTITPFDGEGDGAIEINVFENTSKSNRSTKITVSTSTLTKSFILFQEGIPQPVEE